MGFGKSVIANMMAAFFSKGCNAEELFNGSQISLCDNYKSQINQYNVISLSLNRIPNNCTSYRQYIDRIESRLKRDLLHSFPDADICEQDALWDILTDIYAQENIQQIKDKKYLTKFQGKLGQKPRYTGRILGVGVAYYKDTKKHECKIEVLRRAIK